jgi:hypothetical protein
MRNEYQVLVGNKGRGQLGSLSVGEKELKLLQKNNRMTIERRHTKMLCMLHRWILHSKCCTPWPLVRKRTIWTERPPLVGEVSANFCG